MKKIVLFILVFVLALFLTGCFVTPATDNIEVKVTLFKQEVSCSGTKGIFALNGELPKCGPPPCPGCDSCCPNCPDCPQCEECPECEQCQECPDIPECPTCPTCSPCCCSLTWGDLEVDFEAYNLGDDLILQEVCFLISFDGY